jgi:hypothetical protein
MSNVKTSIKMVSFVKQFVALVEGDTAEAKGQKVFRQADSALNTHIAILTGELVAKEDAVAAAKENQEKALVNFGKEITDRDTYVSNLYKAENAVIEAEEALKVHQEKLDLLKSKSKAISASV